MILFAAATINSVAMEEEKPRYKEIQSLKLICARNILQNGNNSESANINSESKDYIKAIESVDNHIKKLEKTIDKMMRKDYDGNPIADLKTYYSAKKLKKDNSLIENHRSLLYKLINSDSFTNNSKTIISALDSFSILKVCYNAFGSLDIEKMNLLVTILTSPEKLNTNDSETKLALEKIAVNAIVNDLDLCRLLAFNGLLPKLEDEINNTSVTFFMHIMSNCTNPDILQMLLHLRQSEPDSYWDYLLNLKTNADKTIMHYAAVNNNIEIIVNLAEQHTLDISHLIDAPDESGQTPLLLAIRFAHDKSVKHLINNGADINLTWHTRTHLSYAQLLLAKWRSYDSPKREEFKKRNAIKIIQLLKDELYESSAFYDTQVNHRCIIM